MVFPLLKIKLYYGFYENLFCYIFCNESGKPLFTVFGQPSGLCEKQVKKEKERANGSVKCSKKLLRQSRGLER